MSIPTQARQYTLPKLDGIHNLAIREASVPQPKSGQILVKVHAVSLNFRDLLIVKGNYGLPVPKDVIPTSDMAGEIVALGEDVNPSVWKIGDRVAANFTQDHIDGDLTPEVQMTALGGQIDGCLTEYKNFPAYSLVKIPEHLSYEEGATLPCAALTAWNALNGPKPLKGGDYVLIQGTGGVSIFALQFAVACGAVVIATSSSDAKLEIAKKLGARHLINYKTTPEWEKEVLRITNGRGVDHIIEVGGPGTLEKSVDSVRMAGWVHVIGFLAGQGDVNNVPLKTLFRAAMIRGIMIGSRKQFEEMNRLIEAQQIKPLVDKVFGFEEAESAYKYLESQKHVGKVVIKVAQ
ncbi:NAD-P-binding protein [Irpex rosettiformis]|uniref:NAD-P-binding protein n=1 Tax=Irpex rosettiformis TaxID=378272 RepID=A0ACB8TU36_9APHY|nr:NAD-P-binding protein [Irpex rosettiformis]